MIGNQNPFKRIRNSHLSELDAYSIALVQCLESDLIQESMPEALQQSPLTLAMPLTLILLTKPLALTLKSDLIFRHWTRALIERLCRHTKHKSSHNPDLVG